MLLITLLGFILATNYLVADKEDDEKWDKVVKAVEARAISMKDKDKNKELTEKEVLDLNKDIIMAFSPFVLKNYGLSMTGELVKMNPDRIEKRDSLPSWGISLKTLMELNEVMKNDAGEEESKVITLAAPLAKKLGDSVSLLVKELKEAEEKKKK